jgi:hypothetical protein
VAVERGVVDIDGGVCYIPTPFECEGFL